MISRSLFKISFIFVMAISVFSVQSHSAEIQRQELFTRAYKSLSFILTMSTMENVLSDSLTKEERSMLHAVGDVVSETTTINWLLKKNAYRIQQKDYVVYAYVTYPNLAVPFGTQLKRPPQLQFSNDLSIFNLDPAEPNRTAMTETTAEKDIFINLPKINNTNTQIDFANAVSLLIHEFGHKLGALKNQSAVNSMAAKIENYVRSLTSTVTLGDKKISTLSFGRFPFRYWTQSLLFGEDAGPGKPRTTAPFTAFDEQGLFVWVEDNSKVVDLTSFIYKSLKPLIPYTELPNYHYLRQNLILPERVNIVAQPNGNFSIQTDFLQSEVVLPFIKENSYDPAQYPVYEKSFDKLQPWMDKVSGQEITFDGKSYALKSAKAQALVQDSPQFKFENFAKKIKGNNLEIYFQIKGDLSFPGTIFSSAKLKHYWPQIVVQIGESKIVLKATQYFEDNDEFKFILKDIPSISSKDVKIVGTQLKVAEESLVLSSSNVISKAFLPYEITLFKKGSESAENSSASTLRSLQIWNGTNWISLRQRTKLKRGMHLRFILNSTEYLRELRLQQGYIANYSGEAIESGYENPPDFKGDFDVELNFTEESLRQKKHGDFLYVDVNIDQNVITSKKSARIQGNTDWYEKNIDSQKEWVRPPSSEKMSMSIQVDEKRSLKGISYVTQTGKTDSIQLKNQIDFQKPAGNEKPDETSIGFKTGSSKKMRCERLF